jgi:hypothetical protein
LITEKGEEMYICMRDSGFEFTYQGVNYEAKNGGMYRVTREPVETAAQMMRKPYPWNEAKNHYPDKNRRNTPNSNSY